jgi:hypothetical protein
MEFDCGIAAGNHTSAVHVLAALKSRRENFILGQGGIETFSHNRVLLSMRKGKSSFLPEETPGFNGVQKF